VVPYADRDETFYWRNALDVGEYGLGRAGHNLLPGQQCPAHAGFFPALFADETGEPYVHENAVCIFERDADVAWTHSEAATGETNTRRGQELVVRFMAVIGNYDYGINWVFRPDGTLVQETEAHGILEPKGVHAETVHDDHAGPETVHGPLVAPGIVAPYHQHFFNFRLDLDVDGTRNTAVEMNVVPGVGDPAAVDRQGFTVVETPLTTELAARRDLNFATHREWKVINPGRQNSLGYPVGYQLVPGENAVAYQAPSTWVRQRAGFVDHHLWVTPYTPGELYAAGDYPNQSRGGAGLPAWTAADRPVANRDLVLWYTMGLTHITRAEEWPVMNGHRLTFALVPDQFFDRNPALDLPVHE
jgi:primary-amine oxidase